uniref:Uncharacterized protein n=1 Tax=Rhizophora mucronata TaxID=61149 RepID=A0A2P2PEN4_RHIMU
MSYSYKKRNR